VIDRYDTNPAVTLARADAIIATAIAAAPRNAQAYVAKGNVLRARKAFDGAAIAYEEAISLNPNLATLYAFKANGSILAGRAAGALPLVDKAIRLSPQDPSLSLWLYFACHAHMHLGQYDAAIEKCQKSVSMNPLWYAYIDLISAYGWKGMQDEARAAMIELEKLMPGYTVQKWASADWSDNATFKVKYARIVEGLRKAGMREE
jgi:adenylate cyclase